jgi:hypothetical protein
MAIAYEFNVSALAWRATDIHAKTIVLKNTGDDDFWVEVAPPPSTTPDDFTWSGQTTTRVAGKSGLIAAFTLRIAPPTPRTGLGLRTAAVVIRITDRNGNQVEARRIGCRNDAVAKIAYGDVAVTMFTFNPPGDDISGEGEFVEFSNLTNRTLDFGGSTLLQVVFPPTVPGQPRPAGRTERLLTFAPDQGRLDFLNDCLLPPAATLRVLTRGLQSNEGPATVPRFRQRLYMGLRVAVWNNTGDRATLANEFGDLVCSQGYGTEAITGPNGPGPGGAPGTPPFPPPAQRQVVLPPTPFFVGSANEVPYPGVFLIQDGDLVTITTNEAALEAAWLANASTPTGTIKLDPAGPLILPSGRRLAAFIATWIDPAVLAEEIPPSIFDPNTPPPQFDLVGAPQGALIGHLGFGRPFFVGAGISFVARLNQPAPLRLGVNDIEGTHWNNLGILIAIVSVQR